MELLDPFIVNQLRFKYTRKHIDEDFSALVDVGSHPYTEYCVLNTMINRVHLSVPDQKKIESVKATLKRSEPFFISRLFRKLDTDDILAQIYSLKRGESVAIPAGYLSHATLLVFSVDEDGLLSVRHYNSGSGSNNIEMDSIRYTIVDAFQLNDTIDLRLAIDIIVLCREFQFCPNLSAFIREVFKLVGGRHLDDGFLFHRAQDQGNCAWKCLSNWFSDEVTGLEVTPTKATLKMLPKDVSRELSNKKIAIKRLVKMVDYEYIRRIVSTSGPSYVRDRHSDLCRRIQYESSLQRYYKKKSSPVGITCHTRSQKHGDVVEFDVDSLFIV